MSYLCAKCGVQMLAPNIAHDCRSETDATIDLLLTQHQVAAMRAEINRLHIERRQLLAVVRAASSMSKEENVREDLLTRIQGLALLGALEQPLVQVALATLA